MVTAGDILSKTYVKIDQNQPISRLLGKLQKSNEALVFDKQKYLGIVDSRKFLRLRIDTNKTKVKKLIKKSPSVTDTTSAREIARLMATSQNVMLPVLKQNQVKGVVYIWDVLKSLQADLKTIKLSAVENTKKLVTIHADDPMSKAISLFKKQGINEIPVVDDTHKLVGILTLRNLLQKYFIFDLRREGSSGKNLFKSHPAKQQKIPRLPVRNEMTSRVSSITKSDSVAKAVSQMRKRKITAVVVTKRGCPEFVLTAYDLLRLLA